MRTINPIVLRDLDGHDPSWWDSGLIGDLMIPVLIMGKIGIALRIAGLMVSIGMIHPILMFLKAQHSLIVFLMIIIGMTLDMIHGFRSQIKV